MSRFSKFHVVLLATGMLSLVSGVGRAQSAAQSVSDTAASDMAVGDTAVGDTAFPFRDVTRPIGARVTDLLHRVTVDEEISQLLTSAPGIQRLGIPAYNWWNEGLHGVGRAGTATVFPQAIALAATFDDSLMFHIARVISDEARAKYQEALRDNPNGTARYRGITIFSPNINIVRDPRWGRAQETYGEDPYLTSRMGIAFVRGLQGNDPTYFKTIATAKHFAVHSGPEAERHGFNATASAYDLTDTYLPHFEALVREAHVQSVMSAYSGVNGEPATSSHTLLQHYLRDQWKFDGYVVSDCGAVTDLRDGHHLAKTYPEAAALALKAGVDLECGRTYESLKEALDQGLITRTDLDTAFTRLFSARMKLGMFDPPSRVSYAQIPFSVNDTPEHRALARRAAQMSMVLLKNAAVHGAPMLPLGASTTRPVRSIAVIGPVADDTMVLYGNYNGIPSSHVTLLDGMRKAGEARGAKVTYVAGTNVMGTDSSEFGAAVDAAKHADVVVMTLGLSPALEEEELDRTTLELPAMQQRLLERVVAAGTPVVLVLTGGSTLSVNWATQRVPAIVVAWYPGEEGGNALADVLFGAYNPAGRLPLTMYRGLADLPPYKDYDMRRAPGRTYRYFTGRPLFPFGFGLSYTTFRYSALRLPAKGVAAGDSVHVSVDVTNTGKRDGDAVIEGYVTALADVGKKGTPPTHAIRALAAFRRVPLRAGERKTVSLTLAPAAFSTVSEDGGRTVQPGNFLIAIGGGQPARGQRYESSALGVTGRVRVTGTTTLEP